MFFYKWPYGEKLARDEGRKIVSYLLDLVIMSSKLEQKVSLSSSFACSVGVYADTSFTLLNATFILMHNHIIEIPEICFSFAYSSKIQLCFLCRCRIVYIFSFLFHQNPSTVVEPLHPFYISLAPWQFLSLFSGCNIILILLF